MKAKRLTLLMIYGMLLFMVACSTSEPTSEGATDSPDDDVATPEAELTPLSPDGRVKVRLENISDVDFEQIEVGFKGHSEQFASLPAGEMSEERAVEEAYQSVYVKLLANGQAYVLEALDGEGEPPITGGSYIYQFDLRDGTLLVELMVDRAWGELSVTPVIEALQMAGATVSHEPSVQRANLFDGLFGYTVATRELLNVNQNRVAVYVFDDAATAKEASETILPGGTSFSYTREDGTTVEQFEDSMIGESPSWWLFEHFIINYAELQLPMVALISDTLQTEPIHAQASAASEVQIRIKNLSQVDFERVIVNFLGQEVDYGAVPSGKQSSYQSAQEAYHYAWVEVKANGQTYQITPIDYVGETPLAGGQYTYLLDIVDEQLQMAYLPEGEVRIDIALVDHQWYWVAAQKADKSRLFPMINEEHPLLRFSAEPDPNMPGLSFGGYASCNWIGGTYHTNQYNTLMIPGIGMTERLCEAIDSETFFLDFLRGINYYRVQGDYLFLSSYTGEIMTFMRQLPASEPPYATDSHAAIAPIVQAIYRQASEIEVTRLAPSSAESSKASWELKFFRENVTLYVFDDATAASEASKSIVTSDSTARLWQDERFLISYEGLYEVIDGVLNELFGEPLTATPSAKPDEALLDQSFKLKVGEATTIASEELVVHFEAVTEDSRCPVDVECAWEGRVTVTGTISRQDEQLHAFSLALYGPSHRSTDESTQTFDGYSISFVDFQPEPILEPTEDDLPRPEQSATFIVSSLAPATETDASYELVTSDEVEGVIFSQDVAPGLIPATAYWTPSKEDVLALEAQLEPYLQEFPSKRSPDLWQKLPEYKRQYAGIIEEGRQKIYANFFCDTFSLEWQKEPIIVDDGGDCFFQLKYEMETGTFSDLYINGEA